jgi:type III pantothenate kinase
MNRGVIDKGNTRLKIGIFNSQNILIKSATVLNFEEGELLFDEHSVNSVLISNSGSDLEITNKTRSYLKLNNEFTLPFTNLYQTPYTLGTDRIAALSAAVTLFPKTNVLIFDLGTCLTIDFINDKGEFKGGNISPGLKMRYKAMHEFTSKLPLVELNNETAMMGNNTVNALSNGGKFGLIFEIEGYINYYQQQYSNLQIVFTGGDILHLDITQKNKIFADPNFVLHGLCHLLILNEKNINH